MIFKGGFARELRDTKVYLIGVPLFRPLKTCQQSCISGLAGAKVLYCLQFLKMRFLKFANTPSLLALSSSKVMYCLQNWKMNLHKCADPPTLCTTSSSKVMYCFHFWKFEGMNLQTLQHFWEPVGLKWCSVFIFGSLRSWICRPSKTFGRQSA